MVSMTTKRKENGTKVRRAPCVVRELTTMESGLWRRRPNISIHWNRQMVPGEGYCCPLKRVVDNLTKKSTSMTRQTRFWSVRNRSGFVRTITTRVMRRPTAVVCNWRKTIRSVLIGWRGHVHSTTLLWTRRIIAVKKNILLYDFLLGICPKIPSLTAQNPPVLARVLTWTTMKAVIMYKCQVNRMTQTACWSLTSRAIRSQLRSLKVQRKKGFSNWINHLHPHGAILDTPTEHQLLSYLWKNLYNLPLSNICKKHT